ncbi:DUF433 domain-containing protein [Micromonospora sp. NPDC023888]|uniref:DUF433 domain-containing protein n=1 Tax=Micromonospora sp. NPDC023888 TaxID=3155607 RepID=UPI003402F4FC
MTRPRIVVDPAVRWGCPILVGTRTATVDITGMIVGGDTVAKVCDEYALTRHQVLLACWHQAINDRWDCWRAWAFEVHSVLAFGSPAEVDALPDPPAPDKQNRERHVAAPGYKNPTNVSELPR